MAAAKAIDAVEKGDTPTTSSFAQLRVLQPNIREPMMFSCARGFVPEAEMSGDAIEVLVQSVAGEDGDRVRGQPLPDLMEQLMCVACRAPADE